jgi:hypothetical protein
MCVAPRGPGTRRGSGMRPAPRPMFSLKRRARRRGSPACRMNPRSRSGRSFTSISSSTTRSQSSSLSLAARLASRAYLVHPQTPSSGFRSGTYAGKPSATTSGCFASHAFTAFDLLWIWFRSQTTVTAPGREVVVLPTGYSDSPAPARSQPELQALDPHALPWPHPDFIGIITCV